MNEISERLEFLGEYETQKAEEEEEQKVLPVVDKYAFLRKKNLNLFIDSNNEKLVRIKDQRSILNALKVNFRENKEECQKKM